MSSSFFMRVLAGWGVVLSVAVGAMVWMDANAHTPPEPAVVATAPAPRSPSAHDAVSKKAQAPADELAGTTRAATNLPVLTMARYKLCQSKHPPSMSLLHGPFAATLAVHCGDSAHLLRVEHGVPQLLAQLRFVTSEPQTEPYPAPMVAADENADGRLDFIVGMRRVGANGAPAGGAVYLMPSAERGGLLPPQELLLAHPLQIFPQHQDHEAAGLWTVHGRNGHHGDGPELWSYRSANTPSRSQVTTFPVGSAVLGAVDLDLDGEPEWLVSGIRDGQAGLWLWRPNTVNSSEQIFFALGHVTGASIGDVSGDGNLDAVVSGAALWTMQAHSQTGLSPQKLDGSDCTSEHQIQGEACYTEPSAADLNRDGLTDLVSYANGEAVIFEGQASGRLLLARRLPIDGEAFVLDTLKLVTPSSTEDPFWLALIHPIHAPLDVELATLTALNVPPEGSHLQLAEHAEEIAHAAFATLDRL